MKQSLLLFTFCLSTIFCWAQTQIDSWYMNTTNHQAQYDTTPMPGGIVTMSELSEVTQVCYDATNFYVVSEGLAAYIMGPWSNPNTPSAQGYTFKFPMAPTEELGPKFTQPKGGIGVCLNGVKMYGYTDDKSYKSSTGTNEPNGDDLWHSDAWVSEGTTMDVLGEGHADGNGIYHYHATPIALYTDPNTGHSMIIGYMHDGFPIYGPFGYSNPTDITSSIVRMSSSYSLRSITVRTTLPNGSPSTPPGPAVSTGGNFDIGTYVEDYEYLTGTGDLDEHNGRYCWTPDYPGPVGTYAYFLSTDASGNPKFPYFMGPSYYGVTNLADVGASAGTATIPGGVTCGSTGIENNKTASVGFSIFPNPVSDYLNFNFEKEIPSQVIITNALGQSIMTVNSNFEKIELNHLPTGIYNATVLFDNKSETARFIKE